MAENIEHSGIPCKDLFESFEQVATSNGFFANEILADFMKDYIVSNGHPEQVINRWPWNKKT